MAHRPGLTTRGRGLTLFGSNFVIIIAMAGPRLACHLSCVQPGKQEAGCSVSGSYRPKALIRLLSSHPQKHTFAVLLHGRLGADHGRTNGSVSPRARDIPLGGPEHRRPFPRITDGRSTGPIRSEAALRNRKTSSHPQRGFVSAPYSMRTGKG